MKCRRYLKGALTSFVGLKIMDAVTTQLAFKLCPNPVEVNPLAAWYVNANPCFVWAGVVVVAVWSLFIYQLVTRFPQELNPKVFNIMSTMITISSAIVVTNNVYYLGLELR